MLQADQFILIRWFSDVNPGEGGEPSPGLADSNPKPSSSNAKLKFNMGRIEHEAIIKIPGDFPDFFSHPDK
jgi:hypothetical protein